MPLLIEHLCSAVMEGLYRLAPGPADAAEIWQAIPVLLTDLSDSSLGPWVMFVHPGNAQ